jgi:hypothetical protein
MYISGKGRVGPGCFIFNGNRVDMAIKEYDWSRPVSLDRSQRIPIVIYLIVSNTPCSFIYVCSTRLAPFSCPDKLGWRISA